MTQNKSYPYSEPVVNIYNETIATLTWRYNSTDTEWAKINNGTIVRRKDGTGPLKISLQNQTTGKIRTFDVHSTVVEAFYSRGLCAGDNPNGINGWLEMELMPGSAGRD